MELSFETTYEDEEGIERDVEITYDYYAGCKGMREGGVPMEPDEEESWEITKTTQRPLMGLDKVEWIEFFTEDFDDEYFGKELDEQFEQSVIEHIAEQKEDSRY